MSEHKGADEKMTTSQNENDSQENYWLDGIWKPSGKGLMAIVMTMVIAGGGAFLAIRLCLKAVLSEPESKLLDGIMPLLEKLVWPLFFLLLVFMFWRKIEAILEELPGFIRRSEYSNKNASSFTHEQLTKDNALTDGGFFDDDAEESHKISQQRAVRTILDLIRRENGVEIRTDIKMGDSEWVCHGAFMMGKTPCYVTIIPKSYINRLETIVYRVNKALPLWAALQKKSTKDVVLMCCIYGFDNLGQARKAVDEPKLRSIANFNLAFRFFSTADLLEGDGQE